MLFDHCLFLYFRWVHKFIDCLHWFKLAKCGKVLRAINREAAIDEVTIEENEECELDDPDDHEEDDELEKEEIEFEIESAKSGKIIILISINCLVQVKVSQNRTNPPTPNNCVYNFSDSLRVLMKPTLLFSRQKIFLVKIEPIFDLCPNYFRPPMHLELTLFL